MTMPVLVLLAFAGWTLLTLMGSVGIYRWSLILTGGISIADWRADVPQGSDWYRRAMRAHLNCVENLPVYSAIVVALEATGMRSPVIDDLAIAMLVARMAQTVVHIALPPTTMAASVRFALFFGQIICMAYIAVTVAIVALRGPMG
jgi:uncharacterized MAPEG superfamily protein